MSLCQHTVCILDALTSGGARLNIGVWNTFRDSKARDETNSLYGFKQRKAHTLSVLVKLTDEMSLPQTVCVPTLSMIYLFTTYVTHGLFSILSGFLLILNNYHFLKDTSQMSPAQTCGLRRLIG